MVRWLVRGDRGWLLRKMGKHKRVRDGVVQAFRARWGRRGGVVLAFTVYFVFFYFTRARNGACVVDFGQFTVSLQMWHWCYSYFRPPARLPNTSMHTKV